MAKNQHAWSVRGVSRKTRNLAKAAAHKRQVTTGEWISLALITIADEELVVSPKSLLPIGPSPIAPSVDVAALENLGPRERALLALASKRPAPKDRAERDQQSPWSIRGVSQVARVKAAKIAAHRRVTMGEWVNHAIQVYAGQEAGIAAASTPRKSENDKKSQVSAKTLRIVEALARHFDATSTSDKPEATLPDTLREVEGLEQTVASELASRETPEETPERAPDITPDVPPATPAVLDTEYTDQKIEELAEQVRRAESRNEKRLATLTSVLTSVTNRLKLTGAAAPDGGWEDRDEPRDEPVEAAPGLSPAEMMFWESIKDSKDPDAYESYLESFPKGLFASLARRRAALPLRDEPGQPPPSPDASSRPPRRRPPPAHVLPKFDYETLNERAIENTKRRN
jgi:hypothetical protein